MARMTRRELIRNTAGAAAATLLGGTVAPVTAGSLGNMDIYYYDNLIPAGAVATAKAAQLLNTGFTGLIYPGGVPGGTDLTTLDNYLNSLEELKPLKLKTFVSIPTGNARPTSGSWRDAVWSYYSKYMSQIVTQNAGTNTYKLKRAITGLCFDTEGDALRLMSSKDAWEWGYSLSSDFFTKMPHGELLIMHAGLWDAPNDQALYKEWPYFFSGVLQGLAANGCPGGTCRHEKSPETPNARVVLMTEWTYSEHQHPTNELAKQFIRAKCEKICRELAKHEALAKGNPDLKPASKNRSLEMWNDDTLTAIALGLWPLGESPNKQAVKMKAQEDFKPLVEAVNDVNKSPRAPQPKRPILWIYGHESAWMPAFNPAYTHGIAGKQNGDPPVTNLGDYKKILQTVSRQRLP
jgi:hypothetical protein